MGYAIEIIFDSKSEAQLFKLMRTLESNGIENKLTQLETTPHLALSVADDIDIEKTIKLIESISMPPLTIPMYGLGTFQGTGQVIFLLPQVTVELLAFQKLLHNQFSNYSDPWAHYYPDNWMPHCTVGIGIANDKFLNAFQVLHDNMEPITTRAEKIRLIKFHPEEVLYEKNKFM